MDGQDFGGMPAGLPWPGKAVQIRWCVDACCPVVQHFVTGDRILVPFLTVCGVLRSELHNLTANWRRFAHVFVVFVELKDRRQVVGFWDVLAFLGRAVSCCSVLHVIIVFLVR
jgi:hypothetical protein